MPQRTRAAAKYDGISSISLLLFQNIKDFVNKTDWDRSGSPASSDRVTSLYALIVAIFAVGGCVGGILAGAWSNFFGRSVELFL